MRHLTFLSFKVLTKAGLLFALLLLLHTPAKSQTPGTALLHKCAPSLLPSLVQQPAEKSTLEHYTLLVSDLPAFQAWAKTQSIRIVRTYAPARVVVVEASHTVFLAKILPHPTLQFADRGAAVGREELPVPGHNLFVNRINTAHARWPLLNGAGITVSINENRFDSSDVDFRGRHQPSLKSAAQLTDHAHIMASLVAGAGNSDPAGRGAAPGAQILSSNFAGLLPDDDADYAAQNITVQNHSYGIAIENYYGPSALAYDHSVALRPALLHVFSAGNDGLAASLSGIYANLMGFANLTGNFKMAKNVLTVGSVDSFGQVPPLSSRGPAYDGRTKPDLMAFGPSGTSEAAALVSGATAVLQQAFFEQYGTRPAAHTLRAVLLNTTDDIAPLGPDFTSGYGSLNLKNALQVILNQQLTFGEVENTTTKTFPLNLPPNAHNLRVTLAWDDPPAQPGTARSLINDLDLTLLAPNGSVWQPWVLNTAPHPDSLRQPARRGRDSLNNAEQILLDFPPSGLYQIQVYGQRILPENQTFTLTFDWDTLQHFEWDCPVQNDPAIVGQAAILRWTTNLTAATGRIEWRPLGSNDWQLIDPAAPLAAGYRRWLVPDTFAAAQVRMLADSRAFVSDTFLIAPELRMRVGFDCPDSVLLRWNAVGPGAVYQLWGLGNRYLEPLLTTADTFRVLQKKDFPQQVFTVSALSVGNTAGPKSAAPNIATQGAGCYISTFLADLNTNFQVDLTLQLGTTYGVRRVFFEKIKSGTSSVLHDKKPEQEQVVFTDSAPESGTNRYFARIELANGSQLRSDTVAVYYAGESNWLVYPNPVAGSGSLTVLSRTPDPATLELYDVLGRRILEEKLGDQRVYIALPSLPPGCYVWRVRASGGAGESEQGWLVVTGL